MSELQVGVARLETEIDLARRYAYRASKELHSTMAAELEQALVRALTVLWVPFDGTGAVPIPNPTTPDTSAAKMKFRTTRFASFDLRDKAIGATGSPLKTWRGSARFLLSFLSSRDTQMTGTLAEPTSHKPYGSI